MQTPLRKWFWREELMSKALEVWPLDPRNTIVKAARAVGALTIIACGTTRRVRRRRGDARPHRVGRAVNLRSTPRITNRDPHFPLRGRIRIRKRVIDIHRHVGVFISLAERDRRRGRRIHRHVRAALSDQAVAVRRGHDVRIRSREARHVVVEFPRPLPLGRMQEGASRRRPQPRLGRHHLRYTPNRAG